ncbi:hypothetical protein BDP27DRAFT_1259911 [Rhodocollybia butyracea]|uniref:Uncharacterized protein n=1 Tax=Rhodocollybia butyracea TaxID=206335 RepID=A0A9P5Q4D6_9AGAR|nr:hypothetical protein BDP27DRAFT_1259911 [Rhodocollybia butyracea]
MASLTMSPRPFVSSPLAGASQHTGATSRPGVPRRNQSFPSSRGLRPFASISSNSTRPSSSNQKTVKLIQPPQNQPCTFMLNLTQAELSRQEC